MAETKIPVTSVDAPSSWDIHEGPPKSGVGSNFHPNVLISLTAPKPLVQHFKGRHFVGGRYVPCFLLPSSRCFASLGGIGSVVWLTLVSRFVAPSIAKKYDFDVPKYEGIDQIVEITDNQVKI